MLRQMPSVIGNFDLAVLRFLTAPANCHPIFDRVLADLHNSEMLKSGVLVAALCWIWAEALRSGCEAQRQVSRMVLGTFAAILVGRITQLSMPQRLRPIAEAGLGITFPPSASANGLVHWNSMPSDHAVYLVAMSVALCFRSRAGGIVALLWSVAVGILPRLYFGEHYPSDVVAGAAIGLVLMVAAMKLPLPDALVDLPWQLAVRFPSPFYAVTALVVVQMATMFDETREWLQRVGKVVSLLRGS
jgi:undecaprenyl-diphosphatase